MESFEIKNLFSLHGHGGVYRLKANVRGGKFLFERLTDPSKRAMVGDLKGVMQFGNVGVYIKDQDEPNTLESVIETMYAMADKGIDIPKDLIDIGDRWDSVSDFMSEVVPNYDDTRFKPYHMGKIVKWYHEIAEALDMIDAEHEDPYQNETNETKPN